MFHAELDIDQKTKKKSVVNSEANKKANERMKYENGLFFCDCEWSRWFSQWPFSCCSFTVSFD